MTSTINFENMEPGLARIYGLGYAGEVELGSTLSEINGSCTAISENFIEVVVQESVECAVTSTEDLDDNDVRIYPNPAVQYITLEYTNLAENANVNIFNAQGGLVKTQKLTNKSGSARIDLDEMIGGVYLVQVTSNESSINKRILITK